MTYDLISAGSITKDSFLFSERGKIFKTPRDKLAPAWLAFELGEKICVDEIQENIGGVAAGLSIGTKKIGLKSAPFGIIGKDFQGNWVIDQLQKEKIDTSFIKISPNRKTAVSILLVDKKTGERVIFYEKSSGTIELNSLSKAKAKWLFVSSLTGDTTEQTKQILSYMGKNKTKLILAPSTSQLRDGYKNFKKLLLGAEMIFLNRNEAIEIAFNEKNKNSSVQSLIKLLHSLGPKVVCLTDGIKGAYAGDNKKTYFSPIVKVKTVDVTGAGDAFASGFLGFYIEGYSIQKSLKAGIINSANVVKYIGTTKGLLDRVTIKSKM